jgi:phosphoribosyl 1,2-cyclic phosphate phosphodiesterase
VRLTVLGTAAAEGWPALWCVCDACREAARRGGRDIRRRAAYNLDGRVQIDMGPDALAQMWTFGVDYAALQHLLFTHSHGDHCFPENVLFRRRGFSIVPEDSLLHVHGNDHVRRLFDGAPVPLPLAQAEFHLLEPYRPIDLGGITATPLLADHAGEEEAVIFLFESASGAILQGNDTGWFPDPTWDYVAGREIDAVLLDCTYGLHSGGGSHLGAPEVVQAMAELQSLGAVAPGARLIATHFSHNGGALHQELTDYFAAHGIEPAHDGMVVQV